MPEEGYGISWSWSHKRAELLSSKRTAYGHAAESSLLQPRQPGTSKHPGKKLRPKLLLLNDTHPEFSISIKGLENTDTKIGCIEEIRVLQNGQPLLSLNCAFLI